MSHRGTYILARQESPESCLSIFSRCKQYQDGNDGSVKTFRELSINMSTNVVNETENRLLKSGKDKVEAFKKSNIYFIGHRSIYYFAIGVLLTLPMKYILLFAYIAITPLEYKQAIFKTFIIWSPTHWQRGRQLLGGCQAKESSRERH